MKLTCSGFLVLSSGFWVLGSEFITEESTDYTWNFEGVGWNGWRGWRSLLQREIFRVQIRLKFFIFWLLFIISPGFHGLQMFQGGVPINVLYSLFDILYYSNVFMVSKNFRVVIRLMFFIFWLLFIISPGFHGLQMFQGCVPINVLYSLFDILYYSNVFMVSKSFRVVIRLMFFIFWLLSIIFFFCRIEICVFVASQNFATLQKHIFQSMFHLHLHSIFHLRFIYPIFKTEHYIPANCVWFFYLNKIVSACLGDTGIFVEKVVSF